jgi:hypothetical protein
MNVLVLGGSRNIGYFAALRLLGQGAIVTFLLRSLAVFDGDKEMYPYIASKKANLFKGDALVEDDVRFAWEEASRLSPNNTIDLVLFTIGGTLKYVYGKGFVLTPAENLVTASLQNVLCATPVASSPQTRFIVITSSGITRDSHQALPWVLKAFYTYALDAPHQDKLGAERLLAHCAGWPWSDEKQGVPLSEILGGDWKERPGMPAPGSLKNLLVVRPVLLTNGDCHAERNGEDKGYNVSDTINRKNSYTISRKVWLSSYFFYLFYFSFHVVY